MAGDRVGCHNITRIHKFLAILHGFRLLAYVSGKIDDMLQNVMSVVLRSTRFAVILYNG
jgi:hypothetical protein